MNAGQVDWRIAGEEFGSCNCVWACPCQFDANPNNGNCHAVIAYDIREGHFGDTSLDGVRFAEIVSWPGAIHEGNGSRLTIVDESASDEQRDAIDALVSGKHGGAYFEIFASVMSDERGTVSAPIELQADRDGRTATLHIPGIAESRAEPIKNPVTGDEHRVRIDLPDGFEYKQAEIGNTVEAKATSDEPLAFELEDTYAQLNAFDWSPAA